MSGREISEAEAGTDPEDDTAALVGRVIADRYRIDALLGVGGMGAVYRAEHILMKKAVAVKVLHRAMTAMDEVVRRFEREAVAAGRIDHPNVTVATDFGKLADGAFYLVLEYVPGRSLTDILEEEGPLPEERALFIARQIVAGLGAAHAAGIVHRDLKPDNVMLIERGGTKDFVKVLDFGIAKVSAESDAPGSQLTRMGAVFGTPAYMAPEQAAGQTVDHRADLYAVGLVLFEMLAGHPAFASNDVVALLAKQLTQPPPPLPPGVSPETTALVVKLLEKDPALRVPSAADLVLAIDAVAGPLGMPDSALFGAASPRSATVDAPSVRVEASTVLLEPTGREVGGRVVARFAPATDFLRGGRTVRLFGRPVSARVLLATGVVLLVSLLSVSKFHGNKAVSKTPARAEPPPPEMSAVIRRAEEGDGAAVRELEARDERQRTAGEWMGIGKGRSLLGHHAAALAAFARAVAADPVLAEDPVMLHDVRRAADDEATQSRAFEFAAGPLGGGGADVLFDVWAATHGKTETTVLAKGLLDREEVRRHASPPLRVALDLRRTTRCEDVKRLVSDAAEVGDERAFRPLSQLKSRGGCGFLRLNDCYPCLRKDDSLSDALKAVQQRKGPRF